MSALFERILAALPQTQCKRCGFADCQAYAQAIAATAEPINQCPPGGQAGVERLALITGQAVEPLNPRFGAETPRSVAVIDEAWCIGCTLCIKACPTDAIVGANKLMHTVMEVYCTGCELCLPPCPVDCIEMVVASGTATGWAAWSDAQASQAQIRYQHHRERCAQPDPDPTLQADAPHAEAGLAASSTAPAAPIQDADKKQAAAQAALARARARRAPSRPR